MNEEKSTSKMKNSAGEYLAPRVKVVVVKARRRICAMSNSNPSLGEENDDWSE